MHYSVCVDAIFSGVELPEALNADFAAEYGALRGVFEPTPAIKAWLKAELE